MKKYKNWMELLDKKKPQINAAFEVAKKEIKMHKMANMQDEFGEAYQFTDLIYFDGITKEIKEHEIDLLLEAILCDALLVYENLRENEG